MGQTEGQKEGEVRRGNGDLRCFGRRGDVEGRWKWRSTCPATLRSRQYAEGFRR